MTSWLTTGGHTAKGPWWQDSHLPALLWKTALKSHAPWVACDTNCLMTVQQITECPQTRLSFRQSDKLTFPCFVCCCAHPEARGWLPLWCLPLWSHLIFWGRISHWNCRSLSLGPTCLCPTSIGVTRMGLSFLEVAGDLNSGSQVYEASTLPTELPLQNLPFFKLHLLGIEGQIDRMHEKQAVLWYLKN